MSGAAPVRDPSLGPEPPAPPRETHHRHHEHETFDKIVIRLVERWKESELSGDEWRFSTVTELYSKGYLIAAGGYGNDIERALALAPWFIVQVCEGAAGQEIESALRLKHKREEQLCDQPGCREPWTVRLRMKRVTATNGYFLHPDEYEGYVNYRRFCSRHEHRGDCSREDADDNYEVIERREAPLLGIQPDGNPRPSNGRDNDIARAIAIDVLERGIDFSKLPPRLQQLVMQEILDELLTVTRQIAENGNLCEELNDAVTRAEEAAAKAGAEWERLRARRKELIRELDNAVYPSRKGPLG